MPCGGGYFGLSVYGSFQFIVKHIYMSLVFPIDIIYRATSQYFALYGSSLAMLAGITIFHDIPLVF